MRKYPHWGSPLTTYELLLQTMQWCKPMSESLCINWQYFLWSFLMIWIPQKLILNVFCLMLLCLTASTRFKDVDALQIRQHYPQWTYKILQDIYHCTPRSTTFWNQFSWKETYHIAIWIMLTFVSVGWGNGLHGHTRQAIGWMLTNIYRAIWHR